MEKERFKMPTNEQICEFALLVQTESGELPINKPELTNMVALAKMIVDRLYENGDILKPSVKEIENSQTH